MDSEQLFEYIKGKAVIIEQVMRDDMETAVADNDPLLAEVLDYAIFGGGKRIRPLLVMLAAELCGCQNDNVHRLAIAFEYLHVATLVHDDVIDHARERRGRLSVTEKHGMAAAILTGDWLHARSMKLIARYAGSAGLDVFCAATSAMVDGEFQQLRHLEDYQLTEDLYTAIIGKKTAALISGACEMGALFGDADQNQLMALRLYGHNLGLGFQIIDDLLDYQGKQESTGKKIGNDFIEGKITLPLLIALKEARPADSEKLISLISGNRSEDDLSILDALIEKYGGFDQARTRATDLIEQAIAGLHIFSAKENNLNRAVLMGLARYVLDRDR